MYGHIFFISLSLTNTSRQKNLRRLPCYTKEKLKAVNLKNIHYFHCLNISSCFMSHVCKTDLKTARVNFVNPNKQRSENVNPTLFEKTNFFSSRLYVYYVNKYSLTQFRRRWQWFASLGWQTPMVHVASAGVGAAPVHGKWCFLTAD